LSSDKTKTILLPGMCRGGMNEVTAPVIQRSVHPQSEITKKCIYQNLVAWAGVQNFLWMLVARSNF